MIYRHAVTPHSEMSCKLCFAKEKKYFTISNSFFAMRRNNTAWHKYVVSAS